MWPRILTTEDRDIGEWKDDHPLNIGSTFEATVRDLFSERKKPKTLDQCPTSQELMDGHTLEEAGRAWTDSRVEVYNRLAVMAQEDQRVRHMVPSDDLEAEAIDLQILDVDKANTRELKSYVAKHGWFRRSVFGDGACKNAWLLVQHADKDLEFQKHVLSLMESLPPDEVIPYTFAYLWDRIAVAENRPQRFGTQGFRVKAIVQDESVWEPYPIEDSAEVDERRAEVGLEPLSLYQFLCARLKE